MPHRTSARTRSPARRVASRGRRGFTLLEVLVAAIVLLSGLVGVAAATAAALRTLADARLEELSAMVAERRFELLRATPCARRVGGAQQAGAQQGGAPQAGALDESWTVAPHADGAATRLVVTVASRTGRASPRRYETVAPC